MNVSAALDSTTTSILIRNSAAIMTGLPHPMARTNATDIRISQGRIVSIGRLEPAIGEEVLDASDCVIYPGWVNTHHHLFQSLLKGIPEAINSSLDDWLMKVPRQYRGKFDSGMLETAARIGIAELMLGGCTTIADHHYLYYPGMPYDGARILFDVAEEMGVRFVLCRGGNTRVPPGFDGKTPAYLQPETMDDIVADVESLVSRYHDPGPFAMRRVVLAPTTLTYGSRREELPQFARAARKLGIRMHSHMSENMDYLRFCREVHNMSPVEFCADNEWLGPDVWFAHLCHVNDREIEMLAGSRTGVAHCPGSNARIGSGISPVPKMAAAGMAISLAVDGTASNEAGDMISEAHKAWLLHRAAKGASGVFHGGADAVTVEDVVQWGTSGGGTILGIQTGAIAPGYAADIAVYEMNEPRYMGIHDLALAPVVAAGRPRVRHLLVAGRNVVNDGSIAGLDLEKLADQAKSAIRRLKS